MCHFNALLCFSIWLHLAAHTRIPLYSKCSHKKRFCMRVMFRAELCGLTVLQLHNVKMHEYEAGWC